jgi:hypothetical protein
VTRRMFYIALGATVGILVVRKASQAAKKLTPAGMQSSMPGALGGLGEAIREFGENVREGMAEREDVLRTELGLDGRHDVVDS